MPGTTVFDQHAQEYDNWFVAHEWQYRAEIGAVLRCIPAAGAGLEIGVGTGRFAIPCGIRFGVEPSWRMAEMARQRGVATVQAVGERLPFREGQFDFALLVTVICFVKDVPTLLREARRTLKPGGHVIVGFIDRDSPLGRMYESRKATSRFYRTARFYSVNEMADWIREIGYGNLRFCQAVFSTPNPTTETEEIHDGYGDGAFVVLQAQKRERRGRES